MKHIIKIASALRKMYWFIFRPKTFGVKALVIKDNKVLLIKNTYENSLLLPGGAIGKKETPEEAIKRELWEEVGLEVAKPQLLGTFLNEKEFKKDTIHLYLIKDFEKTKTNRSSEIENFEFYPMTNLPKETSKATKERIKELQSQSFSSIW